MPPSANRLISTLLSCGFTSTELASIAEHGLGVGISAITTSTDPIEQAREIVAYALRYNVIDGLATAIALAGADRPAFQNYLWDDSMAPEPTGHEAGTGTLAQVRLENRVERLSDKVDTLAASHTELRNMIAALQAAIGALQVDTRHDQININSKTVSTLVVMFAVIVAAQISLLAWMGMGH